MGIFRGELAVRITGAGAEQCLNRFLQAGVGFWQTKRTGEFTLTCRIYRRDLSRAKQAACRAMCTLEVERAYGAYAVLYGLLSRPVLVLGLLLAIGGALMSQNLVWTIEVEGCQSIPPEEILHQLEDLGVSFGTWGPSLNTEELKNKMLLRVPKLRWLAVNRSGGRVTVLVAEREEERHSIDLNQPANVVAVRPGIITSMQVLNGFAAVEVGQAVTTGQVLVSGLADWTTHTQTTRALAEVYALTLRSQKVVIPQQYDQKIYTGQEKHTVSLVLGRKRIKIWGNSGNSYAGCDKIITRKTLTLPGGSTLPLTLEICTYRAYETTVQVLPKALAQELLEDYVCRYVQRQMVAGVVKTKDFALNATQDVYCLQAGMTCEEMIGATVAVGEIGDGLNGESDQRGTD